MENEVTPQKERLELGSRIELRLDRKAVKKRTGGEQCHGGKSTYSITSANLEMANAQHKLGERAPRFTGHSVLYQTLY